MADVTRRGFLRCVGAGAALSAKLGRAAGSASDAVAEAADGSWQAGGVVAADVVERMLADAVVALTGEDTAAAAWRRLVASGERVGVKFNRVSCNVSGANQALGDAILRGLALAGVRRERVVVAEAVGAEFPGTARLDDAPGREVDTGLARVRLTRFVDQVDALINVADLKHHALLGTTGAVKNLAFGSAMVEAPWRLHGAGLREHVEALFALPAVSGKCRLHLINGLRGIFRGGPRPGDPAWQWDRGSLFASSDAHRLDAVARRVIARRRQEAGLEASDRGEDSRRR